MAGQSETSYPEKRIQELSERLESNYLQRFENTKGHVISLTKDGLCGEIIFGKYLIATREICYGYFHDKDTSNFLEAFDLSTADLGFWSLLG